MRGSLGCFGSAFLVVAAMCVPPAAADPAQAVAFAKNIWPNVNFLDKSSRLAMSRSRNAAMRAFAQAEAADQTVAANALVAWFDSVSSPSSAAAAPRRAGGNMMSAPFRAAAEMSSGVADAIDGVETGRSVAIDGAPAEGAPVKLPEIKLTTSSENLDRLSTLRGRAFDDFYKAAQRDALAQLSTLYASYVQKGEDAGLRNLAVRQLPKIDGALARLRSF